MEDANTVLSAKAAAEHFVKNLSPEIIASLAEAVRNMLSGHEQILLDYETKKSDLENHRKELYAQEKDSGYDSVKMKQRMNLGRQIEKIKLLILNQKNVVIALKNGGDLASFTDKKGERHENVPTFVRVMTDVISFDETTILVDEKPPYIPEINEEVFRMKGYVMDAIRIAPDEYILAVHGYRESAQSDSEDEESKKYFPSAAEQGFVLVTLDQLVLINDYYYTKAKATVKKVAEEKNIRNEAYYDNQPLARREAIFNQKYFYQSLPSAVKKKFTQEQFQALDLAGKEALYKPFKKSGAKRLTSKLDDQHMWLSFHNMYERFLDPAAVQPKHGYANHIVFTYWADFRDMMKWKLNDIKVQREIDNENYKVAIETSFGESNTNNLLVSEYGILVKRQNGAAINPHEISQIETAWAQVQMRYGNLKELALSVGLKISHTGEKLVFASKAAGMYIPKMKTISVSAKFGELQFSNILSHETAHFIDNMLGSDSGKRYLTDNYESLAGRIAIKLRKGMNVKSESDYINATKECFARALEQYFAIETHGESAELVVSNEASAIRTYFSADDYATKPVYDELKPMIEQFLSETLTMKKENITLELKDIMTKYGDTAYELAKKQSALIPTDLARVSINADKIIALGEKNPSLAFAEALQYEFGYNDNWADLRKAVKTGGIELNKDSIERIMAIGIELPTEITEKITKTTDGEPKIQNFTQFCVEKGYPSDYDVLEHGRLGESGHESRRAKKISMENHLDRANKNRKAHEEYEKAVLAGKIIDPSGGLTAEGISERDYEHEAKQIQSKISAAESQIKTIEGLGKMSHLDSGKLKKSYQRAVDDYNAQISEHNKSLEILREKFKQPAMKKEKPISKKAQSILKEEWNKMQDFLTPLESGDVVEVKGKKGAFNVIGVHNNNVTVSKIGEADKTSYSVKLNDIEKVIQRRSTPAIVSKFKAGDTVRYKDVHGDFSLTSTIKEVIPARPESGEPSETYTLESGGAYTADELLDVEIDPLIGKSVHPKNVPEMIGKVSFRNDNGYFVKFNDGSDSYFHPEDLVVTEPAIPNQSLSHNAEHYMKMINEMYPKLIAVDTTQSTKDLNKAIDELEKAGLIKRTSYKNGFAEYAPSIKIVDYSNLVALQRESVSILEAFQGFNGVKILKFEWNHKFYEVRWVGSDVSVERSNDIKVATYSSKESLLKPLSVSGKHETIYNTFNADQQTPEGKYIVESLGKWNMREFFRSNEIEKELPEDNKVYLTKRIMYFLEKYQSDTKNKQAKDIISIALSDYWTIVSKNPSKELTDFLKLQLLLPATLRPMLNYAIDVETSEEFKNNLKNNIWSLIPEELKEYKLPKKISYSPSHDNEGLAKLIKPFINHDALRLKMMGVNFDKNGITATNAHILLFLSHNDENRESKIYCIEKDCLKENDNKIVVDEKFPLYERIIPNNDNFVSIHTESLITYLETIIKTKYFNQTVKQCMVTFGEGNEFAFNSIFLLEAAEAMYKLGYDQIDISYSLPNRAVILCPKGRVKDVHSFKTDFVLVMPLMIGDVVDFSNGIMCFNAENECIQTKGIEGSECLNPIHVQHKKLDEKIEKVEAIHSEIIKTKQKETAEAAAIEQISDELSTRDGMAWDKLNITSGSQLYSDLELQKRYKELMDAETKHLVYPLSMKVHDLLEDANQHVVNQYLYMSGAFGEKEKDKWLKFLSNLKPESKEHFLDESVYAPQPEPTPAPADQSENEEISDAIEMLTELLPSLKGKDKKECKEAIEMLTEMLPVHSEEPVSETWYISYLNKKDNFRETKKEFTGPNAYENAEFWGKANLENFNSDMIRLDR